MITLSSASGTGIRSGTIALNLSIASTGGDQCTACQWSFSYGSDVTLASVALGASAIAASKPLNRAGNLCVIGGFNNNVIGDGVLVVATFSIAATPSAGTIIISFTNILASDANADPLITSGSSGTITVDTPVLACPIDNAGVINLGYFGTVIASGGIGPYTFAIVPNP